MKKSNTKERLQKIMEERNLKQVDILNLISPYCHKYGINFNKSDLSQYVSGKTEPNQDKLFILSQALKVSPAYLMGWEDDSNKENKDEINTIAAHALEDLTEEEQEKLLEYAKFIKSTRGKNEK